MTKWIINNILKREKDFGGFSTLVNFERKFYDWNIRVKNSHIQLSFSQIFFS